MDSAIPSQPFHSILWPDAQADGPRDAVAVPDCFHDLNLNLVEDAITSAWPGENLAPFFRTPLRDNDTILYRQEILRDLEHPALRQKIEEFTQQLRAVRKQLAGVEKLSCHYEKERAFLAATDLYRSAVTALFDGLQHMQGISRGLLTLRHYLADYTMSSGFQNLAADISKVLSELNDVRYSLIVRGDSVTVRESRGEADASSEVEATFAKFRREAAKDYRIQHHGRIGFNDLNHVEAQLLDRIALLYPQAFGRLDKFYADHTDFVDATIARFAREACFYLAWLAYTEPMRLAGLSLCLPSVATQSRSIACADTFDIALAAGLVREQRAVIRNSFTLSGPERIIVVSGPNHGGKTTFARTLGQLHWLAALGCTVPGTSAQLLLFDRLFTHFEREEHVDTLRGKLKDDLYRIHAILQHATPRSVIIVNEIFSSTTLNDALQLGRKIIAHIAELDALAVCVTFLTELASCNEKTVSMVATVDPHDPAVRTYRVERRPADGLAYALAIANKYRVTHDWLLRRIAP